MKRFMMFGFVLGCSASIAVYFIEITTPDINWLLIFSFPVCWTIAGAFFGKNDK